MKINKFDSFLNENVQFPAGSLNSQDYEYFEEKVEEEIEEADADPEDSKLSKNKVLVVDYAGRLFYFEGYDVYDFDGSSFYVVDKLNKLAFYRAEPRIYTKKEWAKDKNDIYLEDDIIPLIDNALQTYDPKLIVLCE